MSNGTAKNGSQAGESNCPNWPPLLSGRWLGARWQFGWAQSFRQLERVTEPRFAHPLTLMPFRFWIEHDCSRKHGNIVVKSMRAEKSPLLCLSSALYLD